MRHALILLLVACRHVPVSTTPDVLANHANDFAATGYAHVEVEQGGSVTVAADRAVAITIPGDERSYLWGFVKTGHPDETQELTVGSLVSGCRATLHGPDCLASRARGSIVVGEQRKFDLARFGVGVFGALTSAAGIACLASCSNINGWAWVGTGLGLGTFFAALTTVY